jgi:hypothetical protein
MVFIRTDKKCLLQNLSSQSGTLVNVRRPAVGVITIDGDVTATISEAFTQRFDRMQKSEERL